MFEDRLRAISPELRNEVGVRLVDLIFESGRGSLQVSEHPGEQEGVKMLYRGAIQFIRNPPMHKLIDYEEETARIYIRLIDSLLNLLAEFKRTRASE